MRNLFLLLVSVWKADDYFHHDNRNPRYVEEYLFSTREECEKKAMSLDTGDDIYNEATIYEGSINENEILDLTKCEKIKEFDDMLAEPYSSDPFRFNYGELEKKTIGQYIFDHYTDEYAVDCSNYNFEVSIEGALLVFWSWQRYIGYSRKCHEIRYARHGETERLLTKADSTCVEQCDVVLTAKEIKEAGEDFVAEAMNRLSEPHWKWTNHSQIEQMLEML